MDYSILVNKDNPLPRASIPTNLVDAESMYKENIKVDLNWLFQNGRRTGNLYKSIE